MLSFVPTKTSSFLRFMDLLLAVKIIIMGIVEGLTEFLPISSTGHLILTGSLLNFTGEKMKVFEIVIQAGAIFAVCWEYRAKIASVVSGLGSDPKARKFALNLIVAFLPAAVLGLLFSKKIKAVLFAPVPVALAFIIGGIIILFVERKHAGADSHDSSHARVQTVDDMSLLDALKIGLAQAFALIPGTSRSGATIIGGMLFGLSRKAATEFSFFLAIPTLLGATVYSLYKAREDLSMADLPMFSLGTVAAFISAFFCVRWLLRYISSHNFNVFAWYRIAFGVMILITAYTGVITWAD
ncbi:undecaprenyl-diphosphatase [Undibacterium pigrum]|uniref:Undecaprenyl-diphosphatase n=2 Tax=Undibacterium pigrum TaxID=401470 RepID=A0A318JBR1_9BURK|nr:undecaprenyl-diphosphatase [Undibacterium pigrum]